MTRNEEIKRLYEQEGKTYREIGQKFDISTERVRQIYNDIKPDYCEKHDYSYTSEKCSLCIIEDSYPEVLETEKGLFDEIENVKETGRSLEEVEKRRMLVHKLRNLGFSYTFIGDLLERDHTTIMHLDKTEGRINLNEK